MYTGAFPVSTCASAQPRIVVSMPASRAAVAPADGTSGSVATG